MPPIDLKNLSSIAQQVKNGSAVNPSLWACAVISLPLFIITVFCDGWIQVGFFIVGLIPVFSFGVSYIFLLLTNPQYLRSEAFQLRAQAISMFGDKDSMLHADATDVVSVITNPNFAPALPPSEESIHD